MRTKAVAVLAVLGLGLASASVVMIGIGALGSSSADAAGGSSPAVMDRPVTETDGPDTYEEALDLPADPLVTNPKAVPDTDAERAAYREIEDQCMWDKGFTWWDAPHEDSRPALDQQLTPWWTLGRSATEIADANLALFGDTGGGADYRWEEAGCAGYATHVTGNDGNH